MRCHRRVRWLRRILRRFSEVLIGHLQVVLSRHGPGRLTAQIASFSS